MATIKTETKLTAAYTELYSPEMKGLCDLAISIIGQVQKEALVERIGLQDGQPLPSKDAVMEAVLGPYAPELSSDECEALARLFGELQMHIVYNGAFNEALAASRDEFKQ